MRTTLTFDDVIYAQAQQYSGIADRSALIDEALRALVQREVARRLARLGGSEKMLKVPPRKRPSASPIVRARKSAK